MKAVADKYGIHVTLSECNLRELLAVTERAIDGRTNGKWSGLPSLTKLQSNGVIIQVTVQADGEHYK